jgi:purine-binding chemotaxis protein CheW
MNPKASKAALRKIVTFRLADDLFGFDVSQVERVIRHREPVAMPDMPPWISGVIELGGRAVPLVDMRRRFSISPMPVDARVRIVVLVTANGPVAVVVDTVVEVAAVPEADVQLPPPLFRGLAAEFVRGLVKLRRDREELLVILDADRVLSTADQIVLDHAMKEPAHG